MTNINYTTVAEVKAVLGITGTSEDSIIGRYIQSAQLTLEGLIGARLDRRIVEEVFNDFPAKGFFYVNQIPFCRFINVTDFDGFVYFQNSDGTVKTIGDELSRKVYYDLTSFSSSGSKTPFTIKYIAGYAPFEQLDIIDFSLLQAGDSIEFDSQTVVEGTNFNAETSNEATATNIYDALVLAGASTAKIEVDGNILRALGSTAFTLTLSNSGAAEIISPNMPEDIKTVIAWIVGGMRKEKQKVGGVTSFTLSSKSVTYSNNKGENVKNEAEAIVDSYASRYINTFAKGI